MRTYTLGSARTALAGASLAVVAIASPAVAQSGPATPAQPQVATQPSQTDTGPVAAGTSQGLGDIVVTAQRREELLQDVPVSITAFNSKQLQTQQITTIQDLVRVSPGMQRTISRGDPTALLLSLRGVPTATPNLLQDSSVGVYLNGVYLARTQGQGIGLVDMASVEVLQGPQGTLFGRNTIGGALNLTTAKPTNAFEGYVSGTYGNFDTKNAEMVVNVPIDGDRLGSRFVYSHQQHDGYLHNTFPGGVDAKALNSEYLRGTIDFKPDDTLSISMVADYAENNSHNTEGSSRYRDLSASPLAFLFAPPTGDDFDVFTSDRGRLKVKNWGVAGTISKMFGDVTVKSITGYRNLKTLADHAPGPGISPGAPFSTVPAGDPFPLIKLPNNGIDFYHSLSEELQVYGDALEGRLKYILGGYYFRERGRDGYAVEVFDGVSFPVQIPGVGTVLVPIQDLSQNSYLATNKSVGAFAQLTYEVVTNLRLTGGIRYTKDTRNALQSTYRYATPGGYFDGATACLVPAALNPVTLPSYPFCAGQAHEVKNSFIPWTVGLDYHASDDLLLYAKVSRGFRSGGEGTGGAPDPTFFNGFGPEKLTSYEGGVKSDLFDHHLRINLAAYYSDYRKLQQFILEVPNFPGARNGLPKIINGGDARIYGGELNISALVLEKLRINSNFSYINAKYTSGPFKTGGLAYAGGPTYSPNTPYQLTPKFTVSLGGDYPLDLGSAGTLNLHADWNYRSKVYFSRLFVGYPDFNRQLHQKGYGLVNGVATFELKVLPVSVSVYAKNIFNQRFADAIQEGLALGGVYEFGGDPRTYGVSVKYAF